MSIKIMSKVWEQSSHEGSPLLLLLALADHASDDGVCWPGIPRLAHKTRKTERHTKRLLVQLEESGEVYIAREVGRGNTNMYYITLGFEEEEIVHTLIKRFQFDPAKASQIAERVIQLQKKGDTQDTFSGEKGDIQGQEKVTPRDEKVTPRDEKGDIAMSPEPSLTVIKPSVENHQNLSKEELKETVMDYLQHCAQVHQNQQQEGVWTVGPEGGGDDPFASGPVDAFALLVGITPANLPKKKRSKWARKLREIAEEWSTEGAVITAEIMEEAIQAIPDSDIGWKTYTTPYAGRFGEDIGPLLLTILEEQREEIPDEVEEPAYEPVYMPMPIPEKPRPTEAEETWSAALGELRLQMTKPTFDTWVKNTHAVSHEDGTFVIGVPNALTRDWLENRLLTTIQRTLIGIVRHPVEVRIITT